MRGGIATDSGQVIQASALTDIRATSTDLSVWVGGAEPADGPIVAGREVAGSFESLGTLGLGVASMATDTNADGSVVVGYIVGASGDIAFIWQEGVGMETLASHLESLGADLTGWSLDRAIAITADGRTIVGLGTNPDGLEEGFVVRLDDVPVGVPMLGPWSGAALALSLAGVAAVLRRFAA